MYELENQEITMSNERKRIKAEVNSRYRSNLCRFIRAHPIYEREASIDELKNGAKSIR